MTRVLFALVALLTIARAGCVPESHVLVVDAGPSSDAGPPDSGLTDAAVAPTDAGPVTTVGGTCASQCETCAGTFGVSVTQCLEGCERRHQVAIDNGCEATFVGWSDCVAAACDEVTRCNEAWRGGRCF